MRVWEDWLAGWREGLRRGLAQSGRALLSLAERVVPPSDTSERQDRSDDATGGGPAVGGPPPGGPSPGGPPPGGPPPHWLARLPATEPPADWLARVQGQMLEEGQTETAEFDGQTVTSDSALPADSMAEAPNTAVSPPDNQPDVQAKRPLPNLPPHRARTRPLRLRWPDRSQARPAPASAEAPAPTVGPAADRANFAETPPPKDRPRLRFVARPQSDPPAPPAFPPAAAPATPKPVTRIVDETEETAVAPPAAPSFPDRPPLAGEPFQFRRESEGSQDAEPLERAPERRADMPTPPRPQPPVPHFPDSAVPPAPTTPRWPNLPPTQLLDPTWPAAFPPNRSARDTNSHHRDTGRGPNPAHNPAWPDHAPFSDPRPPSFPSAVTADYWPPLPDEISPTTNEWEQSWRRWQHWHGLTQEQEGETWNGSSS